MLQFFARLSAGLPGQMEFAQILSSIDKPTPKDIEDLTIYKEQIQNSLEAVWVIPWFGYVLVSCGLFPNSPGDAVEARIEVLSKDPHGSNVNIDALITHYLNQDEPFADPNRDDYLVLNKGILIDRLPTIDHGVSAAKYTEWQQAADDDLSLWFEDVSSPNQHLLSAAYADINSHSDLSTTSSRPSCTTPVNRMPRR